MWPAVRRLSLGIFLIAGSSALLLTSDLSHRKSGAKPTRRLAILQHSSQPFMDEGVGGMIDGLAAAGFVDGKNISIRRYNAENDLPTANTIAKELASGEYELVLTASTLSMQAMANANQGARAVHVFALVSDPFGAGVGISRENPLQHPRHLVGYGTMQPVAEAFQLAKRLFPNLRTVGEVWSAAEANSEAQTRVARETCQTLGIQLVEANVDNTSSVFEAATSLVARGVQALWVGGDVTVLAALDSVVAAGRKGGIPVFTNMPGATSRGSLFDLGANYYEVGRLAGALAAQILNGSDPAKIPVENVLPIKLVINKAALSDLKDAWQFPDDVLRTAEEPQPETRAPAIPPGRVFKIGLVYFAPDPGADICMQGLFDGLRDQGFVQGKNLEIRQAHAQGEIANIPALLQNYDNLGLDLIMPMTTPCLTAACGTVKRTPVVFTYVYDPIAAGAGESFTDHNPNVTGVGSFPPVDETVEMIRQLLPGVKTVGTIYNSSEANSRKVIEVARSAFTKRDIHLEEVSVINSSEVFQAAQALAARHAQAFWITGDNTAIQGFDAIVKTANDARLPIINNDPELVSKGALACVGIGFYQSGYAAARLAARVLLGARPKDVPIENVAVKTVALNLNVARSLGLRFPDAVLKSADVLVDETGVHERAGERKGATADHVAREHTLRTWQVDILEYVNVLDVEEGEKGIHAGLQEAGLVEGRDYRLQVRNAQGDMPTLSALVDAAISEGTDLLMTFSTPTLQAAIQRTRSVPIVFTFVADAIAAGAGRSNDDHLPNVTGVPTTSAYEDLIATVQECLPSVRRVGTLFVPAEVNSVYNKDRLTAAARRHGIEVAAVAANTSAEMPDAAAALCNQPLDAVVQIAGNLTSAAFASIVQAARRAHVPLFGSLSGDCRGGAAVVVARDYFDGGREAGRMAARIMRGESPAAIPFQPLNKTKTMINPEAAQATGLVIPDALRRRVGVVTVGSSSVSTSERRASASAATADGRELTDSERDTSRGDHKAADR